LTPLLRPPAKLFQNHDRWNESSQIAGHTEYRGNSSLSIYVEKLGKSPTDVYRYETHWIAELPSNRSDDCHAVCLPIPVAPSRNPRNIRRTTRTSQISTKTIAFLSKTGGRVVSSRPHFIQRSNVRRSGQNPAPLPRSSESLSTLDFISIILCPGFPIPGFPLEFPPRST
jgi:hypothetical protein